MNKFNIEFIRHKEAMFHGKMSVKLGHLMIKELHKLCEYYVCKVEKSKKSNVFKSFFEKELNPSSPVSLIEITSVKLLPILNELLKRLVPEAASKEKITKEKPALNQSSQIDMRNIFGYLNFTEWVTNLNIGNIMQISPMTLNELFSQTNKEVELSRESILDKISMLVASYFCIATEKRFLYENENKNYSSFDQNKPFSLSHKES